MHYKLVSLPNIYWIQIISPFLYIFYCHIVLCNMSSKCKPQVSIMDAKALKKVNKKMKDCTDEKTNDNKTDKYYLGKKIAGIKNNEKVFIKQEHFGNKKLEKDKPCNKMESLNEELCQLLQQKSKFSILGPISWKTFLFPAIKWLNSNPKKGKKY